MQVKNALNWKIFVFLLCDINQQYQRVLDTRSNTTSPLSPSFRCRGYLFYAALRRFCFFNSFCWSKWPNICIFRANTQYAPAPCKLTFDLLTLKVMSESRVTWATSVPTLVFLGLSVLDLGPMYTTDRQNVRQTSDMHHRLMPLPYWLQEHNKWFDVAQLLHSTVCQHFFTGYTVPKECLHKIGIISPILSLGYFICKREKNLAHRASTIGSRRCGQPLNMLLP